jgi:hypothetical protein
MTRPEFEGIPFRSFGEAIPDFDCLVIMPSQNCRDDDISDYKRANLVVERLKGESESCLHDSGFRFMSFVACIDNHPMCSMGFADVLCIGGMLPKPNSEQINRWSIDCLPTSGLLRLFAPLYTLNVGYDVSSFEIFAKKKGKGEG